MSLTIIFGIILSHWFADFVLQTHWQASNKSKDNMALTSHVFTYSSVWAMLSLIFYFINGGIDIFLFAPITFVCHWVTDYFTSRLNSKLWAKGDVHNFFVSVGFDQALHYVQLFLTYYLLTTK
jgi:hypothetical protein